MIRAFVELDPIATYPDLFFLLIPRSAKLKNTAMTWSMNYTIDYRMKRKIPTSICWQPTHNIRQDTHTILSITSPPDPGRRGLSVAI
jgi:hypothetical protein